MVKDRIYIQDWLILKPYEKQVPSDLYYLKLSNKIKQDIMANKGSLALLIYLNMDDINLLSCFLASYFEDIVSETNLWNTFVKQHTKLYKKPLPFYNTDEYFYEEINTKDVCFLTWYFINNIQKEKFITPANDFIFETGEIVMKVFEAAWEYAPENNYLKTFYTIDKNETNFYVARGLIDNILYGSYLFFPDTLIELQKTELGIIERQGDSENILSFLKENRDSHLFQAHTHLLGFKGKEWAAKLLGDSHPLHPHFLNISQKILGFFLYKGQDETDIFIEHIASGKKFNLTKKSFNHSEELIKPDTILFIGIVQWRNEWWFSGVYYQTEFNADLILDEKNSVESRMAVSFLDHQEQNIDQVLQLQFDAFKEIAHGSQIVFIESDQIGDFIGKYMDQYRDSLKLSKKEREDAEKRARAEGFFGETHNSYDFSKEPESGLVFFNPTIGIEVAFGINSAFPSAKNQFFDPEESKDHVISLLMADEFSKELVIYCMDNFKSKIPFLKTAEGKMFLEDLDFLLRFWKKENYFSKPSISFTGKGKDQMI